jgi:phosphate acetyltransferase
MAVSTPCAKAKGFSMNTEYTASSTSATIENVTYEEMFIGQRVQMQRTLSMEDIKAFAAVSGDVNPAHLDVAYAESTRFHGVIAHGMWAGALISSLLGTQFPGAGTIYMEQSLRFMRPVRVGDTLTISVTVTQKEDASRNVHLDCSVTNQREEVVVSGQALVKAPASKIVRPRPATPELHLFDPQARLAHWVSSLAGRPPVACAVVHPCSEVALRAALEAGARGLITPVLVGPLLRIQALATQAGLSLEGVRVEDVPHSHAAAERAVALAAAGEVQVLLKGSLYTEELMQAVQAEGRLRTERSFSHVCRLEVPAYPRPLFITDAAIHIAPTLEQKADILRNAIDLAHALGLAQPRVALLASQERVMPQLRSTIEAAALCKMADRGQIQGALLDGPLTFDDAVSPEAASLKGVSGEVAGQADILLVPDLEAGAMLAKQLESLAGAAGCGVVLGGRVPIALPGRADTVAACIASLALAVQSLPR